MHTGWVASSMGLPHEGQPIEFVLDDRETVMDGTYLQRMFQSRWTGYEVGRVRGWRSADVFQMPAASACKADSRDMGATAGGALCAA